MVCKSGALFSPAFGSERVQSAADHRKEAERCRRMARSISNQNDPVVIQLRSLAMEHDAKAFELEASQGDDKPTAIIVPRPKP